METTGEFVLKMVNFKTNYLIIINKFLLLYKKIIK